MSLSSGYTRLHPAIQRWIRDQGWHGLRDVQEQAIAPILAGDCDVIISAATAAGKTEAAFLPALTRAVEHDSPGVGLLYLSPLKALINDQQRRLHDLCEALDLPLTPWHGDVTQSRKQRIRREPRGVLLITPESLEARLIRDPGWCRGAFGQLQAVIIDEFHAFIGTERGRQLQSLLHRIEVLTGRRGRTMIPRIALSATLGDMQGVAAALRPPQAGIPCRLVISTTQRSDIRLQLRGYHEPQPATPDDPDVNEAIVNDLLRLLRGGTHLVFAGSIRNVERFSAALRDRCDALHVPNEFFPHHGLLARELREELEQRLQRADLPTTALATSTLELGIDIGSVDSVIQIGAPHHVAALRQRLGRSGRRGSPAILRVMVREATEQPDAPLQDRLALDTVQTIAVIRLLLQKWYEPPNTADAQLSVLAHQTLAVVAQYGSATAHGLWQLLCLSGPFDGVSEDDYRQLIDRLCETDMLSAMHNGSLTLGLAGERLVDQYDFSSVFQTVVEYRVETAQQQLGTVEHGAFYRVGDALIFAGRHWVIDNIDHPRRLIRVSPHRGGDTPYRSGSRGMLHERIRQEMLAVYCSGEVPHYLDSAARRHLQTGLETFRRFGLHERRIVRDGKNLLIFPWHGDRVVGTLTAWFNLLTKQRAEAYHGIIELQDYDERGYLMLRERMLSEPMPVAEQLLPRPALLQRKYDHLVPHQLRRRAEAQLLFDVPAALAWLRTDGAVSLSEQ